MFNKFLLEYVELKTKPKKIIKKIEKDRRKIYVKKEGNNLTPSEKLAALHEILNKDHSNFHPGEEDEEHGKHLTEYTKGSSQVNGHLIAMHREHVLGEEGAYKEWEEDNKRKRGNTYGFADHEKQSNNVSNAIARAKPLSQETSVYSNTGDFDPSEIIKSGFGYLHTPAFTSTSINPNYSDSWKTDKNGNRNILHLKLNKGYNKGAYVEGISHYKGIGQNEMILDKGQTWRHIGSIARKEKDGSTTRIHTLEPVHQDEII